MYGSNEVDQTQNSLPLGRFERLSLPFQSLRFEDNTALSEVREEKLSVLHQRFDEFPGKMKIWVSKKIDEDAKDLSWRSDFVLVVDLHGFNLPGVASVASFLLDEENKVAVCCDLDWDDAYRTTIYIVGENIVIFFNYTFPVNEENKVAVCCDEDTGRNGRFVTTPTRIYVVGENMYKQVYKDIGKEGLLGRPDLLSYVPSLIHIQIKTPKRQKKRKRSGNQRRLLVQ
ncbi:putative F-box/kelch-repeat protein At3g17540 [Eutrema salsugineum]|uniref:putative F-box/kelch-repeat protein At3g17540 n=1 Tax=Eutrema salsugineum TaxID=72664 RepID=UPI000CED0C1B|nr:putative F-box/kelch-repeat protein At3g17540 [Eutrema salsugineum]